MSTLRQPLRSLSVLITVGLLTLSSVLNQAHAQASTPIRSDLTFQVALRGSGSATIHAAVFSNPGCRHGSNVLAVHGFTETGTAFGPLAAAIFSDALMGRRVQRVIAIDMPGHGGSSYPLNLPGGALFGDLTIEDNVSVVLQAIDALRAQGLGARVIVGHSMGGLEIQAAQEALLSQGSSLAAHGVFAAVLLAPVPCANVPFSPASAAGLAQFVVNQPSLGTYLLLPDAVAQVAGGFTTLAGTLAPNAPSVAEITANGYNDKEPLTTVLELTGTLPRPSVRQGAFATRNGTLLLVASFSQDVLVPADILDDLYLHLLGRQGLLYSPVVAPDAVHSMFISNPLGMIEAIRSAL